jgi:hypothetical protein
LHPLIKLHFGKIPDDLSILTNEGVVGLKEVKELLPLHHTLFSRR